MIGKLLWGILFLFLAIGIGVALSLKPWQQYEIQKQKAEAANAEMRAAEQEKADLVRQKMHYESPIGKEQLARERGYKKPSEKAIEVPR